MKEGVEMSSVIDVAKYILHNKGPMTTMKLQKLAYYCQSWSLAWDDEPLFDEEFQAWANGPVCPELYSRHKGMFRVDESLFKDVPNYTFSEKQTETMDSVLEYYGDKEPHWLSALTHQELPWKMARKGVSDGEPSENIIDKEWMRQYYGGLQ